MIGNVYFDSGKVGRKLFIVIGLYPSQDSVLVVKTTSHSKGSMPKNNTECIREGQYFFIKAKYDFFDLDTWIDYTADGFKEIEKQNLNSNTITLIGTLRKDTVEDMLSCLYLSEDMPLKYKKWIF